MYLRKFLSFSQAATHYSDVVSEKDHGEVLDTNVKSTLITRGKRTLLDTGSVRFMWKKF